MAPMSPPAIAVTASRHAPNARRLLSTNRVRLTLGRYFNEGSRLLWGLLAAGTFPSVAAIAKRIGLDESAVHLHMYGDRRPEDATRDMYATHAVIPQTAWDARPSKAFALPAFATFSDRVIAALTAAGREGLDIGAIGKCAKLSDDDCEADTNAILVVYLLRDLGRVERPYGTTRWRLATAKRRPSRKAVAA